MKYLVELNSDTKADHLLAELELEFGRTPQPTGDADILLLNFDEGVVQVLLDEENDRLWVTIEAPSGQNYHQIAQRMEEVLNKSKERGFLQWSQLELPNQ